jgi:hypothetical protein
MSTAVAPAPASVSYSTSETFCAVGAHTLKRVLPPLSVAPRSATSAAAA